MKQIVATLILALAGAAAAVAQTPAPAQTMHDTYCVMCHDSKIYTRENRTARDYESLRAEVNRWQTNVSLNWSETEVDAVTTWLAERYYGLKCPDAC